jgi:hypothetical protein
MESALFLYGFVLFGCLTYLLLFIFVAILVETLFNFCCSLSFENEKQK